MGVRWRFWSFSWSWSWRVTQNGVGRGKTDGERERKSEKDKNSEIRDGKRGKNIQTDGGRQGKTRRSEERLSNNIPQCFSQILLRKNVFMKKITLIFQNIQKIVIGDLVREMILCRYIVYIQFYTYVLLPVTACEQSWGKSPYHIDSGYKKVCK